MLRLDVGGARDPGRVTTIQYSQLTSGLRFLPIILHIHVHLLSLASTFATVLL